MEKKVFAIGYEISKRKEYTFTAIPFSGKFKRIYKSGKDFSAMNESRQIALVQNCLVHSARMLDKRTKKLAETVDGFEKEFINTAKQSFLVFINGQEKHDIFNQAFMFALEMASNEKRNSNPLLLELCKCTTKAINKYYSDGKKKHDDLTMVENSLLSNPFDNPENKAIAECTRAEIFEYLPKAKRANIVTMLDLQECGYCNYEIAEIMNTSEKTLAEWKHEYYSALACAKAENGEFETARAILDSFKAVKAEKAKAQAEKIITDMIVGVYKRQAEKSKAVYNWLNLSYIDRINLFTTNKSEYMRIAKLAFK